MLHRNPLGRWGHSIVATSAKDACAAFARSRGESLQLQSSFSGTHVYEGEMLCLLADIGGVVLLHPYGSAASTYISGEREKPFMAIISTFLLPDAFAAFLRSTSLLLSDNTDDYACLVAAQHECLVYLFDMFAEFFSHTIGSKIIRVDGIFHQLIFNLQPVENAGCICLLAHNLSLFIHSDEQLLVVAGHLHAFLDELHSLKRVHVGKIVAEHPHSVESLLRKEKIIATGG